MRTIFNIIIEIFKIIIFLPFSAYIFSKTLDMNRFEDDCKYINEE